jgi:hypothetical protein
MGEKQLRDDVLAGIVALALQLLDLVLGQGLARILVDDLVVRTRNDIALVINQSELLPLGRRYHGIGCASGRGNACGGGFFGENFGVEFVCGDDPEAREVFVW